MRVRRPLARAALVALLAACSAGTAPARHRGDVATLALPVAERAGTPLAADVAGLPVYLVVPQGLRLTADGRDGRLEVQSETGSVFVTVLAYDTVFLPSVTVPGGARLPASARVSPPPADVVGWLRREPGLRLTEPVAGWVGGLPALQVDITSVRPSTGAPCSERGLCTYVVGSPGSDARARSGRSAA